MINFGNNGLQNNGAAGMNGLGGLFGGGMSSGGMQSMLMQMMQMMQMMMQMFMSMNGGGGGMPMNSNFGGGGGDNGMNSFLGGGGGGYGGGAPSYGGGGPSYGGAPSYGGSPASGGAPASPSNIPWGAPPTSITGITPDQFGLSDPDKGTMCGLVAAQGMARSMGNGISMDQIKQIAVSNGYWNQGMKGVDSEMALLNKMGVPAQKGPVDWGKAAKEVQAGRPVILDTAQHYFVVEGYDPASGQFDFGNTAKAMKASRGRTKFRPEELPSVFGADCTPRTMIFSGAPQNGQAGGQQGQQQQQQPRQ